MGYNSDINFIMSTKGTKLREFQWFQMQTRVRQMVQQLITPFTRRIFQSLNGINQLKIITSEQSIKLEQLQKIVTNDPSGKQIDIFKQIDNKQEELSTRILQLSNLIIETKNLVDKKLEIQDSRLEESKHIILNNMKLKERVSQEIFQQNQSIKQFRTQLQNIINEIQIILNKTIKTQEQDNKANKQFQEQIIKRIQDIQSHNKITDERFQKNNKEHLVINSKIIHLQEENYKVNREVTGISNNLVYVKTLNNYVKQLQEKINKQNFNIQYLAPLITQAQISETLYSVLPFDQKKKLVIYQYDKFSQLNNTILTTDYKVNKQLFNGVEMLENVQKRNTKEIINMKRKKLISMGIDIDNLNYQAKEKYYKEVSLNENEINQEGEIKTNNGVNETEIINNINKIIQLSSIDFNNKLNVEITNFKKYFEEIEDQMQNNLNKSIGHMAKYHQQLTEFKNQQEFINDRFEKSLDVINDGKQRQKEHRNWYENNMVTMIQFCTLINHLLIQDQLDKQSISLFGLRNQFVAETSNVGNKGHSSSTHNHQASVNNYNASDISNKPGIINLQRQCFSCNGYPASTITAFKMACLAYSPSNIKLDSKQYKRQELLQISTKLLQHLKIQSQQSSKKLNTSIILTTPIKNKSHTQPTNLQSIISPPKIATITKLSKFQTTVTSQFRTKTKNKIIKTQQSIKKYDRFTTDVFDEMRKRHSMYYEKGGML